MESFCYKCQHSGLHVVARDPSNEVCTLFSEEA
jgi:hypothetical protein